MPRPTRLTVVVVVLVVAFAAGVAAFWFPHCVPLDRLAQIKTGMTREEVVALLGPPFATPIYPDGQRVLAYGSWRRVRYCTVDVFLDSSDRVSGVFHDH
jgi:hypothetical protein